MGNDGRYSQANRPLAVTTPLGPDVLLLEKFRGTEGMSSLFQFTLDLLLERGKEIRFEDVLGKPLSVRVTDATGTPRHFHGICSRFRQGGSVAGADGAAGFTRYQAVMVPQFWFWTRRVQSRIFQHKTVVDILKIVLDGLDVAMHLGGEFPVRTYCTQYRESDFAFASRLMEEEGISYHFVHDVKSHQLVLTNDNAVFPYLPDAARTLDWRPDGPGSRTWVSIHSWEKAQEVCAQRFTLRDHSFELPQSDLEERLPLLESVEVGPVTHQLRLPEQANLEVYDFPGGYGATFDEINRDGASDPGEMNKVRPDAARRTKLRMEQEAAQSVRVEGESNAAHLEPGFKVAVTQLGQPIGSYLLTRVTHEADVLGSYRAGGEAEFMYGNHFECVPENLRYRPASVTPRPRVHGTQTAIVVGPEEGGLHTDKYGRVKVQFHWDREGKKDIDSSCWIRVLQPWAGQGWGSVNLPRAGQEVVVDFLEGSPDRPIILGSVYNAEQMPPYALPEQATVSGIKSRSHLSKNPEHFNELRMDDRPGSESFVIAAQKDLIQTAENDYSRTVEHNSTVQVNNNATTSIGDDPLTINMLSTWNNIEIDKLSKSVVVGVNHNETNGTKIEVSGARVEGVGTARTQLVGVVAVDWTGVKRVEVVGTPLEPKAAIKSETVYGDKTVTVKSKHSESNDRFAMTTASNYEVKTRTMTIDCVSPQPGFSTNFDLNVTSSGKQTQLALDPNGAILATSLGDGEITIQARRIRLIAPESVTIQTKDFAVLNHLEVMKEYAAERIAQEYPLDILEEELLSQCLTKAEVAAILGDLA